MAGCLLGGLADDRHIQVAADDVSDVSSRDSLVGDRMVVGPGGALFQRQPEQMSSIEPVYRGPAVYPVAYVGRNALLARDANEIWNKAMIARAMHRWRKAQHRYAHAARDQRSHCLFRLAGETKIGSVVFRGERALALQDQGPGSDDQGPVRAHERGAERLDGALVRLSGGLIVAKVMDESCVDHAVRSGRSAAQAVEIFERTAKHIGACGDQRLCARIRTSQPEHLMARANQFVNYGGAYKARRACNKNTHILFPSVLFLWRLSPGVGNFDPLCECQGYVRYG